MRFMRLMSACLLVPCLVTALGSAANAKLLTRKELPLASAQKAINACVALATKNHWQVAVAVRDESDRMIAFARMDGALVSTYDMANGKASTAVKFGAPTAALAKFGFDPKTKAPNEMALMPGVMLFPGGIPIAAADGARLGAIGVSGAMGPNGDETCAKTGLDAIKDELK
jgi:uncharacterized protein GlcG (DUF336 family)